MSYVVGNWTIESMLTDTISSPKTISVPDLDYESDFSERTKLEGRTPSSKADEKYFVNNTGTSIISPETTVYGRQPISNIYNNLEVDPSYQLPQKGGHRVYCTSYELFDATNSVSGIEQIIPMKGTISLDVPDASLITQGLVEDFLKRLISHLFGTGQTDGTMAAKMLRGDLDPTK